MYGQPSDARRLAQMISPIQCLIRTWLGHTLITKGLIEPSFDIRDHPIGDFEASYR